MPRRWAWPSASDAAGASRSSSVTTSSRARSASFAKAFREQASGAKILVKEVDDPGRYGVAEIAGDRVVRIVEKPKHPQSRLAVTGIYFYDESVHDVIAKLRPSARGELEITDVGNAYIARGDSTFDVLPGWWTDAGTFESFARANELLRGRHGGQDDG